MGSTCTPSDIDAVNEDDLVTGTYLAAHVAVAIAATQQADDLRIGARNRTVIGQAQGILWSGTTLTAIEPSTSCAVSHRTINKKLLRATDELVQTRETSNC